MVFDGSFEDLGSAADIHYIIMEAKLMWVFYFFPRKVQISSFGANLSVANLINDTDFIAFGRQLVSSSQLTKTTWKNESDEK